MLLLLLFQTAGTFAFTFMERQTFLPTSWATTNYQAQAQTEQPARKVQSGQQGHKDQSGLQDRKDQSAQQDHKDQPVQQVRKDQSG
jgi:hypothetical protein